MVVGRTVLTFRQSSDGRSGSEDAAQNGLPRAPLISAARPPTQARVLAELVAEDGSRFPIQANSCVLGRTPESGAVEADCLLGFDRILSRRQVQIVYSGTDRSIH